jgi:phenylacetate-CoA ligase
LPLINIFGKFLQQAEGDTLLAKADKLYAKLPVWAQNTAVGTYGLYWYWIRFGPGFKKHVRAYREREKTFSPTDWTLWQKKRLCDVLAVAADHVPYYQDAWGSSEMKAARSGCLDALPFLEKDTARAMPNQLIRRDWHPLNPLRFFTSGTTGTPVISHWTIDEFRESQAYHEARGANWAGVSFSMPRSTFSGRMVEPDPDSSGPFYRFNPVERQAYFSAFHLSEKTASQYVHALHKHHIQWLTGYAISYYLLAEYILDQGIKLPPIRALITTSEKVTDRMKQVMERAYQCKVYEEYNNVENVLFANDCDHGRLHVSPDVGVVEILRPDGTPCKSGEVGEVVATCLFRNYQPLIRYRVGDLAAWDDAPCPCGRSMPVIKEVMGRLEDVIIGPDGRQMVRFHGVFVNQPHIKQGQIIQEKLDALRVKIVPSEGFNSEDAQEVVRRMQQRLGNKVNVTVEIVDRIPVAKSGKYKAVVSLLSGREKYKSTIVGSL